MDMQQMFAGRMSRLGTESAFEVLKKANELEAQGKEVVHLEIGQPDFATPDNIIEAAYRAMKNGCTGYTTTQGIPELRQAIAEYYAAERNVPASADEVVVVPGGGYTHVSAREGDPVALQFAAAGYHTAVLDYAICEKAKDYMPLRQLAEAIGLVRQHAAQWHILPEKIAVCGFSAGGHLALSGAVLDIPGEAAQPRPNAVILGYPVVTAGQYAHRGSFVQLAGSADPAAQQVFGLEDKITPQTPPVFVWTTMEDATVPVENTLMLVNALHRAGVPCEAHLFEKGVHGTSISTAEVDQPSRHRHHWVELAVEWLEDTFAFSVC